ncbi:Hypothetical predicted protein [Paramuricea clavata]|uniref:Uncharacterized protein n=1 Tax=Paramuricea clavata TaxID=317549 RepID=A0A7D9I479_PARCT|nr:Hypothetical predicted protein [Paramuricea clavata]
MEQEAEQAVGQPAVYLSHNISPPQPLDLRNSGEVVENFKLWKEKYNNYFIISRLENESPAFQLAMFKHSLGDEDLKVIKTFGYNEHKNSSDWKVLLRMQDLTLSKCIDMCRSEEITEMQMKSMSETSNDYANKIKTQRRRQYEESESDGSEDNERKTNTCQISESVQPGEKPATKSEEEEISVVRIQAMKEKAVFAKMLVNNVHVYFQVNCGASANILPYKYVEKEKISPCDRTLVMWNGTKVKPLGTCVIRVVNLRNQKYDVKLLIVKDDLTLLLGLKTTEEMRLLTIHKENFISTVFCKKTEVVHKHAERLGVITPVEEPTEWVSQIVVAVKKSGALCVCIDPKPLNEALEREIRRRTFSTPYGRFWWLRLPFGLNVSSEIFQKRLNQELVGLEGVRCIADDILVYGTDEKDHNKNLERLLERCKEKSIKLTKDKLEFKCKEVSFHGHLLTNEGLKVDLGKVKVIMQMPQPTTPEEILRLNRMVNYLSRFLPNLLEVMKPLRDLAHKELAWCWLEIHEKAWNEVKHLIAMTPVLAYYKPSESLEIQCDSSQTGLGVALMQNGHPIAYASRTLSETETRYAQIQKEILSIVYAVEKFNDYTFGRKVTVHSDHKPLESILKKPLH